MREALASRIFMLDYYLGCQLVDVPIRVFFAYAGTV
jgi:hypothetical protein